MKIYLKYFIRSIVRLILKIFYVFPIKRNRIIFISYFGKSISCNPKYIYEFLRTHYGEQFEYIWVLNNHSCEAKGVHTVPFHSIQYIFYALTSKVYISNMEINSYLPKRKGQIVINTWHGGGAYKKLGVDINSSKLYRKNVKYVAKNTDYYISSCRKFNKLIQDALLIQSKAFLNIGMPRNDIFFKPNNTDLIVNIKKSLQVDQTSHIVLYAPTFRDDSRNIISDLNRDLLIYTLHRRFGGDWICLIRKHHSEKNEVNVKYIDVSSYPDMQELLLITDILVTDYSSSIWDFSFIGRPCFLFAPDLNNYLDERNFYTPITEWPFPLAETNEQLEENILSFDEKLYAQAIKRHHEELGNFEDGHATEKVVQIIYDTCFNK